MGTRAVAHLTLRSVICLWAGAQLNARLALSGKPGTKDYVLVAVPLLGVITVLR